MNIFLLDRDVKLCAQYHCDKHVVKMILETAQLLCSAHYFCSTPQSSIPYKLTHKNHPCSIWVRKSLSNYNYLCSLGLELCKEYTRRYGREHKSLLVIKWCIETQPNIPDIGLTEFPQAMPDKYKSSDAITAYRNYYIGEKYKFVSWKSREVPEWFSVN